MTTLLTETGSYGSGMHGVVMDEIEVGLRVSLALDDEACFGGLGWYYDELMLGELK